MKSPWKLAGVAPLLWAVGLGCAPAAPDASSASVFEGARLILGDGGVIEEGTLVVDGERIVAVGPTGSVEIPPGAAVEDLTGRTVIPALIDAHAHLGYEGYTSWGADDYTRDNLIDHLQRYAYYGFGAVFSAGSDPDDLALEIQAAQRAGEIPGARFVFAAGMGPPGQGPNNQFLGHALAIADRTGMTVLRGAGTPEEGRSAVADVAAKGVPFIKVWVDDRGGSQVKLAPPVYRAIAAEARARGLAVFVHQQTAADMPDLLDAGVHGFLHGRLGPGFDADVAARTAEAGAFVVPNLGLGELRRERVSDDPFLREAVAPGVAARLRESFDARPDPRPDAEAEAALRAAFARAIEAGVDIVLGTDAGALPDHFFGYTGHRELEIFVRLGMTPMQAIVAATSLPARHLGLGDMGSLSVGKSADFVVLDENPLDDIRNTRTIVRVYLRGAAVERDALSADWTRGD